MKTFGIIGGMGPQATMDFERKIHEISNKVIPQYINQGYPPMVTYYHRHDPRLTEDGKQATEILRPSDSLLEISKELGKLVDFITIPSNTPHFFENCL